MSQYNLHESHGMSKRAASGESGGIFLSHSRHDKAKARKIAEKLEALHIYYYFDENDSDLQAADEAKDHVKVMKCIDQGMAGCSWLLGLITLNTLKSWWVPYEIGAARNHQPRIDCAYLIDAAVNDVPSYIKIAKVLAGDPELEAWLQLRRISMRKTAHHRMLEALAGRTSPPLPFTSPTRTAAALNYLPMTAL